MYVACGLCVGFICTVSSVAGFPNALSIDYRAERLYWVDAKLDKIETSDLSGEHRVALLQQAPHPFGLTVVSVFVSPHPFGLTVVSVFVSPHPFGLTVVSVFVSPHSCGRVNVFVSPHPFGLTVVSVFVSPHSFPHYFGLIVLSVFVSFHHSGLTLVSMFILDQPVC